VYGDPVKVALGWEVTGGLSTAGECECPSAGEEREDVSLGGVARWLWRWYLGFLSFFSSSFPPSPPSVHNSEAAPAATIHCHVDRGVVLSAWKSMCAEPFDSNPVALQSWCFHSWAQQAASWCLCPGGKAYAWEEHICTWQTPPELCWASWERPPSWSLPHIPAPSALS